MEHFTIEIRLPLLVDENTPPEDILVRAREELKLYGCTDCMGTGVLAAEDFDIRTPAGDHVLTPTLPQGAGWRAVADTLPDSGRAVLVACGDYVAVAKYYRGHGSGWYCDNHAMLAPSHWQPLPTVPGRLF